MFKATRILQDPVFEKLSKECHCLPGVDLANTEEAEEQIGRFFQGMGNSAASGVFLGDGLKNLNTLSKSFGNLFNFKAVSRRHNGKNVSQTSLAKTSNTVFDESVDLVIDQKLINSGKAELLGNVNGNPIFKVANGRQYAVMNNELVPFKGPGIYELNRAQYKILGTLNQLGYEKGIEIINKVKYNSVDVQKAVDVYNLIQKSLK
jgi:hypothetical protein